MESADDAGEAYWDSDGDPGRARDDVAFAGDLAVDEQDGGAFDEDDPDVESADTVDGGTVDKGSPAGEPMGDVDFEGDTTDAVHDGNLDGDNNEYEGVTIYDGTLTGIPAENAHMLPAGWTTTLSTAIGERYFVNSVSGETQWEFPDVPVDTTAGAVYDGVGRHTTGGGSRRCDWDSNGEPAEDVGKAYWEFKGDSTDATDNDNPGGEDDILDVKSDDSRGDNTVHTTGEDDHGTPYDIEGTDKLALGRATVADTERHHSSASTGVGRLPLTVKAPTHRTAVPHRGGALDDAANDSLTAMRMWVATLEAEQDKMIQEMIDEVERHAVDGNTSPCANT